MAMSYLDASSFLQSNPELRSIKGVQVTHFYRSGAGPIRSSSVLLSGSTECATSGEPSTKSPLGELVEQGQAQQASLDL